MKLLLHTVFLLLGAWSVSLSQVVEPNSFKATNAGADVILTWKTIDETNVREFQIERSSNDEPDPKVIGSVTAAKLSLYVFKDQSAFKKITGYYYYNLIIVYTDNSRQTLNEQAEINHSVSGVRRTWGSIKSMFRF